MGAVHGGLRVHGHLTVAVTSCHWWHMHCLASSCRAAAPLGLAQLQGGDTWDPWGDPLQVLGCGGLCMVRGQRYRMRSYDCACACACCMGSSVTVHVHMTVPVRTACLLSQALHSPRQGTPLRALHVGVWHPCVQHLCVHKTACTRTYTHTHTCAPCQAFEHTSANM